MLKHHQLLIVCKHVKDLITKASSSLFFHQCKSKSSKGFVCNYSSSFSDKKASKKHLRNTKKCSKYENEPIVWTTCGRVISQTSFLEAAKKAIPKPVNLSEVISIISPYVVPHEDPSQHAQWLHPIYLIKQQNFLKFLKDLIPLWNNPPDDNENDLHFVLKQADSWITESKSHLGFIRGDHRALLQMLGATDKNEITYH